MCVGLCNFASSVVAKCWPYGGLHGFGTRAIWICKIVRNIWIDLGLTLRQVHFNKPSNVNCMTCNWKNAVFENMWNAYLENPDDVVKKSYTYYLDALIFGSSGWSASETLTTLLAEGLSLPLHGRSLPIFSTSGSSGNHYYHLLALLYLPKAFLLIHYTNTYAYVRTHTHAYKYKHLQ